MIAAGQLEGAYDRDGKRLSVTDAMSGGKQRFATIGSEESDWTVDQEEYTYPNHRGIDRYDRSKEDFALFTEMGFKCYHFLIARTRIFPDGDEGIPNETGLEFYGQLIDEYLKYDIEPVIMIPHYEIPPHPAKEYGGWKNRKLIDFYERFVQTVLEGYSSGVKRWITSNEINSALHSLALSQGLVESNGAGEYQNIFQTWHSQFVASSKVVKIGHGLCSDIQIDCMIICVTTYSIDANSVNQAATMIRSREFNFFCTDVQIRGEHPAYAARTHKKYGVDPEKLEQTEKDFQSLKEHPVDYVEFSYYMSTAINETDPQTITPEGNLLGGVRNPFLGTSEWGWQIGLEGLRIALNESYNHYQRPLFTVENGLGATGHMEEDGTTIDDCRTDYLCRHIEATINTVADGADLMGYTPWGYMDLADASIGEMSKHYGFIHVDLDDKGNGTLNRSKRKPFDWYKEIIASNGTNL